MNISTLGALAVAAGFATATVSPAHNSSFARPVRAVAPGGIVASATPVSAASSAGEKVAVLTETPMAVTTPSATRAFRAIRAQTSGGRKSASSVVLPEPTDPVILFRAPAHTRVSVTLKAFAFGGVTKIPENEMISCRMAQDVIPDHLMQGDTFIVGVDPESASPGGAESEWSPAEGTLIVFKVTHKETVGKTTTITFRAKELLVPRSETSDYVIPIDSGNLLFPQNARPSDANVGKAGVIGATVASTANEMIGDSSYGGFAKAQGYLLGSALGMAQRYAAGGSTLHAKVKAGTPVVVRINAPIRFVYP